MAFIKQGTCDRCGQCCGADSSPNQANPWPEGWLETHQKWTYDHFNSIWPYAILFGLVPDGSGNPIKQQEFGSTRISGGGSPTDHYWVWVEGRPCKDISVAHDGSSYSLECPFLEPTAGDPTNIRPCGLKDRSQEAARLQVCDPEGPDVFQTQANVDQWESDHPLCSHTWIEE